MQADKIHQTACDDCRETVTVVEVPAARRGDNPHWAEALTDVNPDYQLCWKCGKVLWSPL